MKTKLKKYLIDEVKRCGGLCLKWTSPNARGVPDRIVILPGGAIYFIELKAPNGTYVALQKHCKKTLEELGCRAYGLYSVEVVKRWLDEKI